MKSTSPPVSHGPFCVGIQKAGQAAQPEGHVCQVRRGRSQPHHTHSATNRCARADEATMDQSSARMMNFKSSPSVKNVGRMTSTASREGEIQEKTKTYCTSDFCFKLLRLGSHS